jgi:hypothetical protein
MPIDEKKRVVIEKQAKEILDKFSKALAKVSAEEVSVEREQDRREEGKKCEASSEFRNIMFENAPQKQKDFIVAERKSW